MFLFFPVDLESLREIECTLSYFTKCLNSIIFFCLDFLNVCTRTYRHKSKRKF